jgi:hypothetical protein
MANGLSLVLEVYTGQGPAAAAALQSGLTAGAKNDGGGGEIGGLTAGGPNILHYAWAVALPPLGDGKNYILLSTTYDEDFSDYITDLVNANKLAFNEAAAGIVGMRDLRPIEDNLTAFVQFVLANDLTKGGMAYLGKFFAGYSWTVGQILGNMGAGPGSDSGPSAVAGD